MENLNISDAPPQGPQPRPGRPRAASPTDPSAPASDVHHCGAAAGHDRQYGKYHGSLGRMSAAVLFATPNANLPSEKLMVALRDGRKLIGVLRSWDQFANLVLQDTVERVYAHPDPEANPPRAGGLFADIKRGIFLVRGENVLLLGEIDLDKDDDPPVGYEPGDLKLVQGLANERKEKEKTRDKGRIKKLSTLGFEGENMGEILL
ncbi:uncharacterized protein N0V96_006766 [Colletotrichum fioriniae]|uniref:uncharacterized protein n=1 Tax=Colletotrichum fioriniae TaxID=710243 RepID=UPI0032DA2BC3|nr:hypothetical protein N0V96_006766 [Colletotrichum fioriniae]